MRQPKPFFRTFTSTWYVTLNGKQINLGKDEEQAFARYHELMAGRGRATVTYASVAHLFDAYLGWLQKNRSEGTFNKVSHYLNLFAAHIGKGFTIARLDAVVVMDWVESNADWTSTTGHDAVSIVQRAFNWAVKRGHLHRSPVQTVEGKPRKKRREIVYSPSEWRELRELVKDQEFGDFIDFMKLTGCRPIEARTLCAHHVDIEHSMAIFPSSEAKGKQDERVIFLPEAALEICKRLMQKSPEGPILRNTRGNPWSKDAINCRFQRLKKKLNRPLCAYGIRHTYTTEGLKKGIDSLTLAQLLGHADLEMISRNYQHLARNPDYLREQANKLTD